MEAMTSPTLRERIEDTLRTHLRIPNHAEDEIFRTSLGVLRDALVATVEAQPVPSRETLEEIFRARCEHLRQSGHGLQCLRCKECAEAVMAWATGTGEPPRWCEHFQQNKFVRQPYYLWLFPGINPEQIAQWTVCPICGAKRPEASG